MQHSQGRLTFHLAFTVDAPWTVLFGPSGSGKTTILRTIAGFVHPKSAEVKLAGTPLVDTASGIFVAPHLRPLRSAGQTARLFPGQTVRENIRYGMTPDAAIEETVLHLFRIAHLAEKLPRQLSGGEQQRVSVARAAASAVSAKSQLLLLDEPFAGLDYTLRDALVVELQEWLQRCGVSVLSVTHDVGEVFLLNAEVIQVSEGRILAQGSAAEVLAAERNRLLNQLH